MTLSCQWSTVSLYRTLYRIPVSYPCIVSYPFCMYRILVFYPCIVFVLYEYVLRSHRIVGYQYTYRIHKIYNFSGIQLNTHLMDTTEYSPVSSNMSIHQENEERIIPTNLPVPCRTYFAVMRQRSKTDTTPPILLFENLPTDPTDGTDGTDSTDSTG